MSTSTASDTLWPTYTNPAAVTKPRPRKRRRTAGGAGEDCWTCKRRAVTCDRKRPYCTQCIDIGRECSGYKTVLSWGVGVASRGKLRGLSCPVANKNIDGSDVNPAEKTKTSSANKPAPKIKTEEGSHGNAPLPTIDVEPGLSSISLPPIELHHTTFHSYSSQSHAAVGERSMPLDQPFSQDLAHSSSHPSSADINHAGLPATSFPKVDDLFPPTHYRHSVPNDFSSYPRLPPITTYLPMPTSHTRNATRHLSYSGPASSTPASGAMQAFHTPIYDVDDPLLPSGITFPGSYSPLTSPALHFDEHEAQEDARSHSISEIRSHSLSDSRFSGTFFHISPHLQSLMEHYDRNVCPFLVAFDGNDNPYRKHILQLAINNEGLQNAIAALSSNNLRMRRKAPQQIGSVHEIDDSSTHTANEVMKSESCYKQMAIDQLNLLLKRGRQAAQDDSVLATLLILCLYHVCDSGFSKFKTQLAGVQKLLASRDPQAHSDFTRWVGMFFTWFDVMTSTVNDREMEIKGDSSAMLDFSSNLGATEQFSGCDGRLFKLIARLGRLNLLSQGRDIKRTEGSVEPSTRPAPTQSTPTGRPAFARKKSRNKYPGIRSLSAADYENIDGNGWGTPIIPADEDSNDDEYLRSDGRDEFWAEWREIREHLESFEMDAQYSPWASSPHLSGNPHTLEGDRRDMVHINECFRYSALLYTERLGHPHRPSSHQNFQLLVTKALINIESLAATSCVNKFLLWPLFIVGTECVDESHMDIIRKRCIQVKIESGFYNNISTLDVLEKVWAEAGVGRSESEERRARRRDSRSLMRGYELPRRRFGQAFQWRKAMDRVDGEYIVI